MCRCAKENIESHNGFFVCVSCGKMHGRDVSPLHSFKHCEIQRSLVPFRQPYTRSNRFSRLVKRISGHGPTIPDEMISFCQKYNPRTYEHVQFLVHKLYRRETGMKLVGWE